MLATTALYVLDQRGAPALGIPPHLTFAVDRGADAAEAALQGAPPDAALMLYVHGRGAGSTPEPEKSLTQVLPTLETEQNARVVMFFWPGSAEGGGIGFPEDRARAAAADLGRTLQSLGDAGKYRRTMLIHSLGSIVAEEYLRNHIARSLPVGLLDTVIFTASASKAKAHAQWLQRLDFAFRTFVIVNKHDNVLTAAGIGKTDGRLGKKVSTLFAGDVPLAPNVEYVDVREADVNHRYFIRAGQNESPVLRAFFDTVLVGHSLNWSAFPGVDHVEHRDGTSVYYFD